MVGSVSAVAMPSDSQGPPPDDPDAALIPEVIESPSRVEIAVPEPSPESEPDPDPAPHPREPGDESPAGLATAATQEDPSTEGAGSEEAPWRPFILGPDWTRRVELGFNGNQGNTESTSLRANFVATRRAEREESRLRLNYQFTTRDSRTVANRFFSEYRYDRLRRESRWRSFYRGSYERDQFQDWDHRLTAGGGFGFQFIEQEGVSMLARGGISGAMDIGGVDSDPRAEAILGVDYSNQINDRHEVSAIIDFLPSVTEEQRYRLNARAEWEILVDPDRNLSLRIGGEERFDSEPGGTSNKSDISYFVTLAVEF